LGQPGHPAIRRICYRRFFRSADIGGETSRLN
jgi:hypothetical protein